MESLALLYTDLQQYKKNPSTFNSEQTKQLEKQVNLFLNDFLSDKIVFETDAASELLTFFQKASVFENLHEKIKQARKKLQQKLKDFDQRYGLTDLENVPAELIEKNIDKINVLSQMPLKARPAFKQMFDIMERVDLTDENGNSLGQEGRDRVETTIIELAKTDAFFSLLGSKDLSVDEYFNVLHDAMQVNLIGLFYTEEIAKNYPLNGDMKQKAQDYMEKLVNLIK